LYRYLKEKQEIINRSTFLSPTYASFQYWPNFEGVEGGQP
jgi:hypothetical protein